MSPLSRSTSPTFFWIVGAVIGLCACIMASYLGYCALQFKRGNGAALAQPRARLIGFACLAIYGGAVLLKVGAKAIQGLG